MLVKVDRGGGDGWTRSGRACLLLVALGVMGTLGCEPLDDRPEGPGQAEEAGVAGGAAVEGASAVGPEELQELAERALEGTEVSENADVLLDEIGARMSALPSGDEAEAFAYDRFEAYGLEEVRRETFDLLAWDRGDAHVEIVEPADAGISGEDLSILSLGHVGSFDVEAPLVDAGYGTAEEIEALGDEVDGAVVLVDVGQPDDYGRGVHRTEKITLATEAGAEGWIQVNTQEGPRIPVGVATLGDEPADIPALAGDRASGEALRDALTSADADQEDLTVRLTVDNWMERSTADNILGEIPGQTDEAIIVGGHLDSWDLATGALDNGSGSLAVLDVARALAEHVERTGEQPLRTIRFALWMGEELGLYGSIAHVDRHVEEGTVGHYAATLNLDVVSEPTGLGAMGRPEAEPVLTPVLEALEGVDDLELSDDISTGGGIYSDHQPFLLEGLPVLTVQTQHLPEASGVGHTHDDTRDILDEPGISASAAVSSALLWSVANDPDLAVERWEDEETAERLEELDVRDPLERAGQWPW